MHQPFLIGEALSFGWEKTRAHSGVLFQGMLALFAIEILNSIVQRVLGSTPEGIIAMVLLGIISFIVGAGFTVITVKLARHSHASYRDLIPKADLVWRYALSSLLVGLLVVVGFILLIIPGIYLLIRFSMAKYAVIDGAGAVDSLRKSSVLTEGIKWRLLGFMLVLLGINLLGAIAFLVGLLVTVPVSAVALAHVYDKLAHRKHHAVEAKS